MKYLFCLCVLPFLLASEVKQTTCPDGKQCPFGKTCCNLPTGNYGCCDSPTEDLEKRRAMASPNDIQVDCSGTACGIYCHEKFFDGVCCANKMFACPKNTTCCTNQYSGENWCCPNGKGCSSKFADCERANCDGTECGIYCHEKMYEGVCCDNKMFACPKGNMCCTNQNSGGHWCCPNEKRCGSKFDRCPPLTCNGTMCDEYCVENLYEAVCCEQGMHGCPKDTQCCSLHEDDEHWCCPKKERCGAKVNKCENAASSTSIAVVSVLFAFILAVTSKRFL